METDDLPNIPRNVHLSSKGTFTMENVEGCMNGCVEDTKDNLPNVREIGSSGHQVQCTLCGINERNNCIILCNACQAAYHILPLTSLREDSQNWLVLCILFISQKEVVGGLPFL